MGQCLTPQSVQYHWHYPQDLPIIATFYSLILQQNKDKSDGWRITRTVNYPDYRHHDFHPAQAYGVLHKALPNQQETNPYHLDCSLSGLFHLLYRWALVPDILYQNNSIIEMTHKIMWWESFDSLNGSVVCNVWLLF